LKKSQLPKIIAETFDKQELRMLLFELGLNYDNFAGEGMADKAREVVAHFMRRNEIERLLSAVIKRRPNCFEFIGSDVQKRLLPAIPPNYVGNGGEEFYRYLRNTLYSVDSRTRRLNIYVTISVVLSITNFILILILRGG